ncbi:MAG: AAA family ATPase, partial [Sterolibacterium sp.]|nr:AAA family ATPase [Sterolibacterium sp.]
MLSRASESETRLNLQMLGDLRARLDGQILGRFGYAKLRALLAYLVLETRHAPAERVQLAELLWPQVDGKTARSDLRRTLHDLRQALSLSGDSGDSSSALDWFVVDRQHIGFRADADCWLDVDAFCHAEAAENGELTPFSASGQTEQKAQRERVITRIEQQLALYRGEFLQGLSLPDAPDFERWLSKQRTVMKQQAVRLLRILSHHQAALGLDAQCIASLERALRLDPCAEDLHAQLMQALARSGRKAEALRQFDACRSVLWDELGSEPATSTLALARAIRRGELAVTTTMTTATSPASQISRQRVCVLACDLRPQQSSEHEVDLRWLTDCHGSLMDIVNNLGGYGVALHTTCFLAYFGYPQPHEHAARQAVEAALDMVQFAAVTKALELRVGAHCGWLVNHPHFLLPDADGIATRQAIFLAQQLAWGDVAICPQLAQQVERDFTLADMPSAIHGQRVCARNSAMHSSDLPVYRPTAFVGRSAELRQLHELWQAVCQGAATTVLLCADPGMGKSRLIRRFQERVEQEGTCWTLHCLPEFSTTPFYPCAEFLERLLERARTACLDGTCTTHCDTTEQRLACWLTHEATVLAEHRMAFVELLHLPSIAEPNRLSKQERRQRVDEALFALFDFLARQTPSLFVME